MICERMTTIMALVLVIGIGFLTALKDGEDWGAGASGSPVFSSPYWFLSSKKPSQAKGLPPILVFAVVVAKWSDGTAAPMHQE